MTMNKEAFLGRETGILMNQFSSGCSSPFMLTSKLLFCETKWLCGYQRWQFSTDLFLSHTYTLLDCLFNKSRGKRKRVIGIYFKWCIHPVPQSSLRAVGGYDMQNRCLLGLSYWQAVLCWSISLWVVVKINDISLPFTPRDHSVILPPEKAICKAHRVALAIKKEQKSKAKLFLQGKDTTLDGLCALLWFPNTYYAHKTETTPLLAFSLQGLYLSSPWVLSYCFYPTFCSVCFETRMGIAHTDVCKG